MSKLSSNVSGFSIVELLLVLVVISAIGTIGFWSYSNMHRTKTSGTSKATSTSSTAQTIPIPKNASSVQILSTVQSSLAKKFKLLPTSQMPTKAGELSVDLDKESGPGPSMSVPGYNFYVSPNGASYTITLDPKNTPDLPTIKTILKQEFGTLQPATVYFDSQPYTGYQNDTTVCYYNTDSLSSIDIACADKSAYPSAAATMKPLADAYIAANPSPYKHEFSDIKISQSKTPGYMLATMGTDDSVGFFYEKSGTWHIYEDNQSGLFCDFTYSAEPSVNNDARLAFLGQPCSHYLGSPDSTVE